MISKFPIYRQLYEKDCGATCLKILAKYYGKVIPIDRLTELSETSRIGTSISNLAKAAEVIGFRSLPVKISLEQLNKAPLPCILYWNNSHFVVLYKIKKSKYYLSDPALGKHVLSVEEFKKGWLGNNMRDTFKEGIALLLEVTPDFYEAEYSNQKTKIKFDFLRNFFKSQKPYLLQLGFGLLLTTIIQLILPYLTQSLVDYGITDQNIHFIYLILFAQIFLIIGKISVEIIRNWILLYLGARFKINLESNFLIQLMKMPISYFDTKLTGDILQRMKDLERIKIFSTTTTTNLLFGAFNILIFGVVLAIYDLKIFGIFFIGTLLYFLWFAFFLRKRAYLDNNIFIVSGKHRSKIIEIVNGMQEIKLNNAEEKKRWSWEKIQVSIYNINIKILSLIQYQNIGANTINELKNVFIIFYAAKLVVEGSITLGMMLAIMYIIGQLNTPIKLLLTFIREFQDAYLSLKRLNHFKEIKKDYNITKTVDLDIFSNDITISNLSFKYSGKDSYALKNISLNIPQNKTTAIVGKSGSGKTTLIKLMLKFYNNYSGEILIGNCNIKNISDKQLRESCGIVSQEVFIFNETVANNICLYGDEINKKRLKEVIEISNLEDFINDLPLGVNTPIGAEGMGISMGEKQRILIARALYKNPKIILFDEATSSLDTENERTIINNLDSYFKNKTSVIIAHRLSTVKNAEQIIVLDKGCIVEIGNHNSLTQKRGAYYKLVKNQLELGA